MKLQVLFYRTGRGDEPVRGYLENLRDKQSAGLTACIERLMTTGYLQMPHGRKMAGHKNLFEIRHGRHRILYSVMADKVFLLHAFVKKSQQTFKRDIETALERMKQIGGNL